jgi:hypothetical protein
MLDRSLSTLDGAVYQAAAPGLALFSQIYFTVTPTDFPIAGSSRFGMTRCCDQHVDL